MARKVDILQFELLTKEDKLTEIEEEGVFIEEQIQDEYKVRLMALYDFYVEVRINTKSNETVSVKAFKSKNESQQVSIDDLV